MSRSPIALRPLATGVLVALALCACSKSKPEPDTRHLGHWESLYRGRGGEANGLVFKTDSTVDRLRFRAFDFRYRVEGDSLFLVPMLPDSLLPKGDTVPPVYHTFFSVTGDTLMRADSQRTEWLVRDGPAPHGPASIVGAWRVVRSSVPTAENGFERFRTDSVLQVRIPAGSAQGTYRLSADDADTLRPDSLVFFFSDDTSRCVISWRADTLELTRTFTNGTYTFGYLRAGDELWYREGRRK